MTKLFAVDVKFYCLFWPNRIVNILPARHANILQIKQMFQKFKDRAASATISYTILTSNSHICRPNTGVRSVQNECLP